MRLISFSVTNFRSITNMHTISLSNLTTLVGKNNEGKSNILTALQFSMDILMDYVSSRIVRRSNYNWQRDFPIQLQCRKRNIESIFNLIFRLENNELEEFHKEMKIMGNEDIPIRIKINKCNEYEISVPKKGTSSYNKKSNKIAKFISNRISFNYISAIRTDDLALESLKNAIYEELKSLTKNESYQNLLHEIYKIQQQSLDKISKSLNDPLKVFLPKLKEIKIIFEENTYARPYVRPLIMRDIDILIDDGTPTSIKLKGDGIKSLITLALLKNKQKNNGASIIAIEEPEAHLHPGAIRELNEIILKIAKNNQVILTTHNPLFVQQNNIKSNIIVRDGKAAPAKNIAEIREILGIMPGDNLKNSNKVIVVEGDTDINYLKKILSLKSKKICNALENNSLTFVPLFGVSNLTAKLSDLQNCLCDYVVLLDNDQEGKVACERAKNSGLIDDSKFKFTICIGKIESEFEDCLKTSFYQEYLLNNFAINIDCQTFNKSKKKWSQRLKDTFLEQGNTLDDIKLREIKIHISNMIPDTLSEILVEQQSQFLDSLENIILKMLENN